MIGFEKEKADASFVSTIASRHGLTVAKPSKVGGLWATLSVLDQQDIFTVIKQLKTEPGIRYAEPLFTIKAYFGSNDTYAAYQWHLDNIGLADAHSQGISGTTVAVIDDGIVRILQDFAGSTITMGYDFVDTDSQPCCSAEGGSGFCHATHVAGTIAQATNNGEGTAAIAEAMGTTPPPPPEECQVDIIRTTYRKGELILTAPCTETGAVLSVYADGDYLGTMAYDRKKNKYSFTTAIDQPASVTVEADCGGSTTTTL